MVDIFGSHNERGYGTTTPYSRCTNLRSMTKTQESSMFVVLGSGRQSDRRFLRMVSRWSMGLDMKTKPVCVFETLSREMSDGWPIPCSAMTRNLSLALMFYRVCLLRRTPQSSLFPTAVVFGVCRSRRAPSRLLFLFVYRPNLKLDRNFLSNILLMTARV